MAEPLLLSSRAEGVLTLQLNRPQARNAINRELRRLLRDALQAAAIDDQVRLVVVRGDQRAFCAGGDVKEMGHGRGDTSVKLALAKHIVQAIADMPKPVIAVVQGHAAGAGFSLALACDLIVADETAQFSSPFIELGLIPDLSGTYWLLRQVGLHRAKDIFLTGRRLDAREAFDLGLVSRLWPAETFENELGALVARLSQSPGDAMGLTKRLLNRAFETDLSAALDAEQSAQLLLSEQSEPARSARATGTSAT